MSNPKKKFVFDGSIHQENDDGSTSKTLVGADIKAGDNVSVDTNEDGSVTVNSNIGLSVQNGLICCTYQKEVE